VDILLHAFVFRRGSGRQRPRTASLRRPFRGTPIGGKKAFRRRQRRLRPSASSRELRRDTANNGAVNLGTLGTRFGGIAPEADVSAGDGSRRRSKKKQKARGRPPESARTEASLLVCRCRGMFVAYLASEDYDPTRRPAVFRAPRSPGARAGPGPIWRFSRRYRVGNTPTWRRQGRNSARAARAGISTASSSSHGST